jgi:hypothetical protein
MSACDAIRPLVSALADGELSAEEAAPVTAHLETCAPCREARDAHAAVSGLVARHAPRPAVPPERWARFDADLARELAVAAPARPVLRLRFLAPLVAAAATLAFAVGLALLLVTPEAIVLSYTRHVLPDLAYLEAAPGARAAGAGRPAPPGLRGVAMAEAARALTFAQNEALERDGLVETPGSNVALEDFYRGENGLVTADAAFLVHGGAVARAALAVERDDIAPGLATTLTVLGRELEALARHDRSKAMQRGLDLARDVIGVAAALDGVHAAVAPGHEARVARDAASARAGTGTAPSVVLGRDVDWEALAPRGDLALLEDHARTVAWLAHADLHLDAAHPDEARAAAFIVLALANGRTRDGARLLALWNDLDDAATFLHGPQDDLGAFEVLGALERLTSEVSLAPSALDGDEALERLVLAARAEAEARPGKIASDGDAPGPRFRLLGGTRSIEALVTSRLAALPGRRHPTSLDLLAGLGSAAARTIVSEERIGGYGQAFEALAPLMADVVRVPRPGSLKASGVERSRLFAIAKLLERPPASAPAVQRTEAYRDRLLLAGLAALDACGASPEEPGELVVDPRGPVPAIEPLPLVYARLAYSARRLALGLDATSAARSPAVARATARLRRVSEVLSGLALAAEEALRDEAPSAEARLALQSFASAAHVFAPPSAVSVEDVHVLRLENGTAEILERASGPLDRIYMVLPVPGDGSHYRLAVGPALAACEVATATRLAPADVLRGGRFEAPSWATHVVGR